VLAVRVCRDVRLTVVAVRKDYVLASVLHGSGSIN
jgi:hypothetical protein